MESGQSPRSNLRRARPHKFLRELCYNHIYHRPLPLLEFNDSRPGEAAGNDGGCVPRSGIAQPYLLHFASLRRGCCNTFAAKWNEEWPLPHCSEDQAL